MTNWKACLVVKDGAGQKLAYVYYEEDPAGDQRPTYSPKTRRGGLRRISPSCRSHCANKNDPDYMKRPGPSSLASNKLRNVGRVL